MGLRELRVRGERVDAKGSEWLVTAAINPISVNQQGKIHAAGMQQPTSLMLDAVVVNLSTGIEIDMAAHSNVPCAHMVTSSCKVVLLWIEHCRFAAKCMQ